MKSFCENPNNQRYPRAKKIKNIIQAKSTLHPQHQKTQK
jgi:hypothetical protein